jgi:transposase
VGTGERGYHQRAGQAWGDHVGANPVDRGKPGSKLHLVCDDGGVPLSVMVTAANVNDTIMFQAVVDDIAPVRTPAGWRRTRPGAIHADKGDDSRANRAYLRRRGIKAGIARRRIGSSARLGRHRWKVERALSWLSCFRRLQVRWDRDAGAVVRVRAGGQCVGVLQPPVTSRRSDTTSTTLRAPTRDEPVNLSDSRSATHQHCSPAGATCCQSLLLDPDATMLIGLRKRLFLLVTGRGE